MQQHSKTRPASKPSRQKPKRPKGSPIWPHPSGQWCRKHKGTFHYFGPWHNHDAARADHDRRWKDIVAGRDGTNDRSHLGNGWELRDLCNLHLEEKRLALQTGELSERSYRDAYQVCEMLVEYFGKHCKVNDITESRLQQLRLDLKKKVGVVTWRNRILGCRAVFRWANKKLRKQNPPLPLIDFEDALKPPKRNLLDREKNSRAPKLFTREEVLALLDAADVSMRAMILLGINCGFGNTDIANLPKSAIDWATGWVVYPRPKTQEKRRVPLWPETLEALQAAISERPMPKDPEDEGLCFLTKYGHKWVRYRPNEDPKKPADVFEPLTQKFGKLLRRPRCPKCGALQTAKPPTKCNCGWKPTKENGWTHINGRQGLGFYTFRHCVETVGGDCKDQVAVDAIMGHKDTTMAGNYRQGFLADERLLAVTDTVHNWLFPTSTSTGEKGGAK